MSVRTISRWECPTCGKREQTCACNYSGGSVQVWYVEKGDHLRLVEENERLRADVEKYKSMAFGQLGDNHHNAALCPYCSPVAVAERDRLIAELREAREALARSPVGADPAYTRPTSEQAAG